MSRFQLKLMEQGWVTFVAVVLCGAAPAFAAKPSITSQPVSQKVMVGQSVTFTVTATGSKPLSYQWRFNGASISAATNTGFTIANVSTNDAGGYSVVVANHAGGVTSSNAILGTGYAPSILEQPDSLAVAPGSNAIFTVIASGTPSLFHRWQLNESDIPDATNATLTITAVEPAEAGVYAVIVTNDFGSAKSFPATLTAVDQTIVMDFESLAAAPGTSFVIVGHYYREKGFVLSPLTVFNYFSYWQTNSPNYPGSTALFFNSQGNYACLERGDGGCFDLISIDLCSLLPGDSDVVTLTGYSDFQAVAAYQAQLGTNFGLRTFHLPGFTNLTEVRWQSGVQFDNIVVNAKPGRVLPPCIRIGNASQFNSIFPLFLTRLRVQAAYMLEKSSDLVGWQPFVSFTANTTTRAQYDIYDPKVARKFYRMRPLP